MKKVCCYIEKSLSIIMYGLPIFFLVACYFFMVVSCEDIWQGAGIGYDKGLLTVIQDIKDIFLYNSRLSDMYANFIINSFDLSYSFGIDTIFRMIDVLLVWGIIYFITAIAIGEFPKLKISDAIAFAIIFILTFLSKICDAFYVSFSFIHNYMIIALFSILFFIPFVWKLQGKKVLVNKFAMLLLGFLFGFSSNVTPVAFLISILLAIGFKIVRKRLKIVDFFKSWEFYAIIGILLAFGIMYIGGKGYSSYTTGYYVERHDYVSIENLFNNPKDSIIKIIEHAKENFTIFSFWLVAMLGCFIFEIIAFKKDFFGRKMKNGVAFVGLGYLFVVIHILIMSQISIELILRISIPAYFIAISVILFSGIRIIRLISVNFGIKFLFSLVIISVMSIMIWDMGTWRLEYNKKVQPVIEKILDPTDNDIIYVSYFDVDNSPSKIFGFLQYPLIYDYILSRPVCGKKVILTY